MISFRCGILEKGLRGQGEGELEEGTQKVETCTYKTSTYKGYNIHDI